MPETFTIHLPKSLARDFRDKSRGAKTIPNEVLRQAAADYVKNQAARDAAVEHIRARAGT